MARLIDVVKLFDKTSYASGSTVRSAEAQTQLPEYGADYVLIDLLLQSLTADTGKTIIWRMEGWSTNDDAFDAANADVMDGMRVERSGGAIVQDNFTLTVETGGPTFLDQQWTILYKIGIDANKPGIGIPRWIKGRLDAPAGAMTTAVVSATARMFSYA